MYNEYINIVPAGGCSSYVGMMGNGQDLRLWFSDDAGSYSCSGPGLAKGTVIHEFLHALGKIRVAYYLQIQ